MKTNQFENTIRRKLESIQPDFQEADWAKMQNYMHAHTPPTFWQQYSSWIGYAAAASVTSVMAFLYVNQLSMNNELVADVKNLKNQIEVIRQQPTAAPKPDTVYLVQTVPANDNGPAHEEQTDLRNRVAFREFRQAAAPAVNQSHSEQLTVTARIPESAQTQVYSAGELAESGIVHLTEGTSVSLNAVRNTGSFNNSPAGNEPFGSDAALVRASFGSFSPKQPLIAGSSSTLSRKMNYNLASRLSTRQVQRMLNNMQAGQHIEVARTAAADKKVEQVAKAENVVPQFNIKTPYRFGGGIQVEGNGTAKTVVGEVLVAKKFSITAGISWLKVKPMEFLSEKIFREKVRKDFKRSHPQEVPLALDVYNIKVNPTLVQIPLTVAFRNTMKDNWAYYAGVGTNITLSSREKVSFDCVAPNKEYFTREFDKKTKVPTVGSANISMGIEKAWHPVVVQAEGYLYTYFTPLTPMSHSTGPGVKLKVLYQIGGKM